MMSNCTTALVCIVIFMLWFFINFETISFYKGTVTYQYADQEPDSYEAFGNCRGKDCVILHGHEEVNGEFVAKYSAPYDIRTYWISK